MNSHRTHALTDLLQQVRGITAVIGGGGKSTLLACGGRGLAARGARAILATSTHMLPVPDVPLVERGARPSAGCGAGAPTGSEATLYQVGELESATGKLTAPTAAWNELAEAADHVLVEADGSRGLPFKAHNEYEPVIPEGCARVIYVVGASGFGRPVYDVVHRPQVFRRLTACAPYEPATPELVARGIAAEGLVGMPDDMIVVNQVEDEAALAAACALTAALADVVTCPVYAGSLRAGQLIRLA